MSGPGPRSGRDSIRGRNKEVLAKRKAEGMHLAAPGAEKKLHNDPLGSKIDDCLKRGINKRGIVRLLDVSSGG